MALTERDKRVLRLGGAVAAALVVGFLLLNLLGGGEDVALPSLAPPTGGTGVVTGSPTGTGTDTITPTASFGGRDPFSVPPGFSPTPTGGDGGDGGDGGNGGDGGGPDASETIGGHTVVLVDTFTQDGVEMVHVEVDGNAFERAEGETFFGGTYEVDSITGDCATFLYGEQDFTLCVTTQK
jgi:hypothetical protein